MTLSTGMRSAIGESLCWLAAGLFGVGTFVFYDEVKSFSIERLGIDLAAEAPRNASLSASVPTFPTDRAVTLKSASNGHYLAKADINGRTVEVMVDTGASVVALTWDDARRAGLYVKDADFTHAVSTANGTARVAPVTLQQVRIGDLTVRNVAAVVSEPHKLQTTLLGMSFLGRLKRVDMRAGTLVLHP